MQNSYPGCIFLKFKNHRAVRECRCSNNYYKDAHVCDSGSELKSESIFLVFGW